MSDKVTFEGDEIEAFRATIRQYTGPINEPLLLGEFVPLKVIARVAKVDIAENERTGIVSRDHILKVVDIEVVKEEDDAS